MQNPYSPRDARGFVFNGHAIDAPAGRMLAAALIAAGHVNLRTSPRAGAPRGAFCLMGSCQECRVLVDGELALACRVRVRSGMTVESLPDAE